MARIHDNPTRPRVDRANNSIWARAPYNFVPLPETTLTVDPPLAHDRYHLDALTGWIECELETCSPTYVRGIVKQKIMAQIGDKGADELSNTENDLRANFYSNTEQIIEGRPIPRFPASSLRGMVRQLVEVLSFGRMRWVATEPTFTFRAVAAQRSDPLSSPYLSVIGPLAKNVRAGYFEKRPDGWYIRPATPLQKLNLMDDHPYIKVKEQNIGLSDIPGFIRLNSSAYLPQVHPVSFEAIVKTSSKGSKYTMVTKIGSPAAGLNFKGFLVCSGNMIESGGSHTRRKSHALVPEADKTAVPIKVNDQVIRDYVNGMSQYVAEKVKDAWQGVNGCLADGKPVFYVQVGKEITCFGHSPNFRIPARQTFGNIERAATPLDFVPPEVRTSAKPDMADALFGWVEEEDGPKGHFAGRVSFSDAVYSASKKGVWYRPEPIIPSTLSNPKPTTFQHYLEQSSTAGHSPDDKSKLAHYGTSPMETRIRGYKFYWVKGSNPPIEATGRQLEHKNQLTRIVPINPGVSFRFKVYFENLRPVELGALLWAIALPAKNGQSRHRLGMGKPLGMGVVKITSKLVLTNRVARYLTLFDENQWNAAASPGTVEEYVNLFEKFVLQHVAPNVQSLSEVDRIQALMTMLEWREGDTNWLDWTRYMEIEREPGRLNEYKERPVLPRPDGVVSLALGSTSAQKSPDPNILRPTPPKHERELPSSQGDSGKPSSGPGNWTPGNQIRGTVYEIEANGDLYIELQGVSTEEMMGRVRVKNLGGKKYQQGNTAALEIIDIVTEGSTKIVDCRPVGDATKPGATRQKGTVTKFGLGENKNYGFISPDNGGRDLFVHANGLSEGLSTLEIGQRVDFRIGRNMKGKPIAQDVKLIKP